MKMLKIFPSVCGGHICSINIVFYYNRYTVKRPMLGIASVFVKHPCLKKRILIHSKYGTQLWPVAIQLSDPVEVPGHQFNAGCFVVVESHRYFRNGFFKWVEQFEHPFRRRQTNQLLRLLRFPHKELGIFSNRFLQGHSRRLM